MGSSLLFFCLNQEVNFYGNRIQKSVVQQSKFHNIQGKYNEKIIKSELSGKSNCYRTSALFIYQNSPSLKNIPCASKSLPALLWLFIIFNLHILFYDIKHFTINRYLRTSIVLNVKWLSRKLFVNFDLWRTECLQFNVKIIQTKEIVSMFLLAKCYAFIW